LPPWRTSNIKVGKNGGEFKRIIARRGWFILKFLLIFFYRFCSFGSVQGKPDEWM
jgi:hypothetical protein